MEQRFSAVHALAGKSALFPLYANGGYGPLLDWEREVVEVVHIDGDDVTLSGGLRLRLGRLKHDDLCLFQRVRPAELHGLRSLHRRLNDNDAVGFGLPVHFV